MRSETHLAHPRVYSLFHFPAAFLLGIPVGFLFRPIPIETPPTSGGTIPIPTIPPVLSFWGYWQFPVLLFFSIMLSKIISTFIRKQGNIFHLNVLPSLIILLLFLLLLICGIAPEAELRRMGLYWNSITPCYTLLNPFVIGLGASFIFEDASKPIFSPGKAFLIALLAWFGTATLFFILVQDYDKSFSPMLCFHVCTTRIILVFSPVLFCGGLLISMIGGCVGGWLCHFLLARESNGTK